MSEHVRNVISRTTLLITAAALIYGGWRCCVTAKRIYADERARIAQLPRMRQGGGWVLPGVIGVGLLGVGGILAAGGVLPLSLIHRLRPSPPRLHDNPAPGPISNF